MSNDLKLDDIELEGREEEEYTEPSKLRPVDAEAAARVMTSFNSDGSLKTHIKALKSDFVKTLIHLDGKPFDFTGREYLNPVYNRKDKRILLKTSRQVEKCCNINELTLKADGVRVPAGEIKEGDLVACLNLKTQKMASGKVVWKSKIFKKNCYKIKTNLGHELTLADTHPVRTWEDWTEASNLKVGDRIATPRKAGVFGTLRKKKSVVSITALMIAEGHFPKKKNCFFTQKKGEVLDDFTNSLESLGIEYEKEDHHISKGCKMVSFLYDDMEEMKELKGENSYTLRVPSWVFRLTKPLTSLFLNRIFSGDGHVKQVSKSKYDLVYASMCEGLVRDVQALLWKYGIPSSVRSVVPSIYKKRREFHKKTYHLRVLTSEGVTAFLTEIKSLGKSEGVALPELSKTNNNRDTYPKGMADLIKKVYESSKTRDRRGTDLKALFQHGLKKTPEYCLSKRKARRYLEFFEDPEIGLDKDLVREFRNHLESDIYWDKIKSIEFLGENDCVDFEVECHHNYIIRGDITHNSTFLANNLTVMSCVMPFNKSLYVSPSHTQTRQFSSEKLKPAIEKSPLINRYLQDSSVSNQVFEKGFTNGSFVFLRSAFRSADRARGISARVLTLDEIQDLLISDIPVIMECTSHFEDSAVYMAGTPKSFDNPIEQYWEESTQNEWLVPCSCGEWVFLDETTIAPTEMYISGKLPPGPVCSKCMMPIEVEKGKWFSMAPSKMIVGYRIPQLMVPWIIRTLDQWTKLLWKRDNYPYGQFANEVLGLSYDAASKPISRAHLIKACESYDLWDPDNLTNENVKAGRRLQLVAGIDWGEGNDGSEKSPSGKLRHASYTVLTVGHYVDNRRFKLVLAKRYTGKQIDPDFVVADIFRIIMNLSIRMVGADWGHGWGVNNTLIRKLSHKKVMVYQYLPNMKKRINWDHIGVRWQLQRNLVMSELFYDMKNGHLIFPRWEQFETFAKDILAIYSEYSDFARSIRYDHRTSDPDDFFHSLLLCKQTADIYLNKDRSYTRHD